MQGRASGWFGSALRYGLWLLLAVVFSFILISAQELSFTWLALMILGLSFIVLCFLSGAPQRMLFICYAATVSVEITKGLIAEGGVYTPGLYLSLSDLFLLPLLASCIFSRVFKEHARTGRDSLMTAAMVWLLWQWLRGVTSPAGLGGILAGVNQTKYFLALWVCADLLRQPKAWRDLMLGLAIGISLHLLMSILQVATSGAFQLQGIKASTQQTISYAGAGLVNLFRPSGLLSHPNALADYLVLLLPAALLLFLLGKRTLGRAHLGVLFVLSAGLFMLVLTLSRGGWAAFAVGMLVMVPLAYQRGLIGALHVKRFIAIVMLALLVVAAAFPTVILRLTESDNRSTSSRLMLAEQALLIIQRNPVAGVGMGAYNKASHQNLPTSFSAIEPGFRDILLKSLVHNKYLLVTAESGLIGLLLFLNLFRLAILRLWRTDFPDDPVRQALAIGLMAGIAASLVSFMFEPAEMGVPIETLWVALGSTIALTRGQGLRARKPAAHRGRIDPFLARV